MCYIFSRIFVIVISVLVAALAVFMVVFSGFQMSNYEKTTKGNMIYGKTTSDPGCTSSTSIWSQYRPLRFYIVGDTESLYCGHDIINSLLRMAAGVLALPILLVTLLGSALHKRWLLIIGVIALAFLMVGTIVLAGWNLYKGIRSYFWCTGGFSGVVWTTGKTPDYHCDYGYYVLMNLTEVAVIITFLFVIIYGLVYAIKCWDKKEMTVDDLAADVDKSTKRKSSKKSTKNKEDDEYDGTKYYSKSSI